MAWSTVSLVSNSESTVMYSKAAQTSAFICWVSVALAALGLIELVKLLQLARSSRAITHSAAEVDTSQARLEYIGEDLRFAGVHQLLLLQV